MTHHQCALCNNLIEDIDMQFGEFRMVEDEYYHVECYAEYFDEPLEEALEV